MEDSKDSLERPTSLVSKAFENDIQISFDFCHNHKGILFYFNYCRQSYLFFRADNLCFLAEILYSAFYIRVCVYVDEHLLQSHCRNKRGRHLCNNVNIQFYRLMILTFISIIFCSNILLLAGILFHLH